MDLMVDSTIASEASSWTLSSYYDPPTVTWTTTGIPSYGMYYDVYRTLLGGYKILGPTSESSYGQYFQRIYPNVVPHKFLTLSIIMWFIDQDRSTTYASYVPVTFYFDGIEVDGPAINYASVGGDRGVNCGGDSLNDICYDMIRITTPHSGTSLDLRVINKLDTTSDLASIGFKSVVLFFSNYTGSTTMCHTSPFHYPFSYNQCSCYGTYPTYLFNQVSVSGVCTDCATGCYSCYGPNPSQCLACYSGYYWNGFQCTNLATCTFPCEECYGTTTDTCFSCIYPAYNYGNGTCRATCDPPYVPSTVTMYNCQPACDNNYYKYPDYTCQPTCDPPFVKTNDPIYGLLCSSGSSNSALYLFGNGKYDSICPSELKAENIHGILYCNNSCPLTKMYYFPDYSYCAATCIYPYKIKDQTICAMDLTPKESSQSTTISNIFSTFGQINFISSVVSIIVMFSDPSSVCLISLTKMLFYIRYLDVTYPPLLQSILDKQTLSLDIFNLFSGTIDELENNNPNKALPWVFQKYNLTSTFLIAFWTPLMIIIFLFILIVMMGLLNLITRKKPHIHKIVDLLTKLIMWNFFVTRFMSYYDQVILYTSLDFRTTSLDSSISKLSFVVCLTMIIISLGIPIKTLYAVIKMQKVYKKNNYDGENITIRELEQSYYGYSMLFKDFHHTSVLK